MDDGSSEVLVMVSVTIIFLFFSIHSNPLTLSICGRERRMCRTDVKAWPERKDKVTQCMR